jgi:hypothetical protein
VVEHHNPASFTVQGYAHHKVGKSVVQLFHCPERSQGHRNRHKLCHEPQPVAPHTQGAIPYYRFRIRSANVKLHESQVPVLVAGVGANNHSFRELLPP